MIWPGIKYVGGWASEIAEKYENRNQHIWSNESSPTPLVPMSSRDNVHWLRCLYLFPRQWMATLIHLLTINCFAKQPTRQSFCGHEQSMSQPPQSTLIQCLLHGFNPRLKFWLLGKFSHHIPPVLLRRHLIAEDLRISAAHNSYVFEPHSRTNLTAAV